MLLSVEGEKMFPETSALLRGNKAQAAAANAIKDVLQDMPARAAHKQKIVGKLRGRMNSQEFNDFFDCVSRKYAERAARVERSLLRTLQKVREGISELEQRVTKKVILEKMGAKSGRETLYWYGTLDSFYKSYTDDIFKTIFKEMVISAGSVEALIVQLSATNWVSENAYAYTCGGMCGADCRHFYKPRTRKTLNKILADVKVSFRLRSLRLNLGRKPRKDNKRVLKLQQLVEKCDRHFRQYETQRSYVQARIDGLEPGLYGVDVEAHVLCANHAWNPCDAAKRNLSSTFRRDQSLPLQLVCKCSFVRSRDGCHLCLGGEEYAEPRGSTSWNVREMRSFKYSQDTTTGKVFSVPGVAYGAFVSNVRDADRVVDFRPDSEAGVRCEFCTQATKSPQPGHKRGAKCPNRRGGATGVQSGYRLEQRFRSSCTVPSSGAGSSRIRGPGSSALAEDGPSARKARARVQRVDYSEMNEKGEEEESEDVEAWTCDVCKFLNKKNSYFAGCEKCKKVDSEGEEDGTTESEESKL
eukprot:g58276.t1